MLVYRQPGDSVAMIARVVLHLLRRDRGCNVDWSHPPAQEAIWRTPPRPRARGCAFADLASRSPTGASSVGWSPGSLANSAFKTGQAAYISLSPPVALYDTDASCGVVD